MPNLEEVPWEPQAMTFHFLGEEFSLKGPNKQSSSEENRDRGLFSQACSHIPRVAVTISLCFSGFFQLPASDIPWAAMLGGKGDLTVLSPHELTGPETKHLQDPRCWPPSSHT